MRMSTRPMNEEREEPDDDESEPEPEFENAGATGKIGR